MSTIEIDTKDMRFLQISPSKLTAKYIGRAAHQYDVGSVKSSKSLEGKDGVIYFEATIVHSSPKCGVFVGFVDSDFPSNRQPGWEPNSFGYCGEDGKKYNDNTKGESYSDPFKKGDVIGCGFFPSKNFIFFTRNGKYLDVAFKDVEMDEVFGCVGLHEFDQSVSLNFGSSPFLFPISSLVDEEVREKEEGVESEWVGVGEMDFLVLDFVLHHGFEETLSQILSSKPNLNFLSKAPAYKTNSLAFRSQIRKLIFSGKSLLAADKLLQHYTNLLSNQNSMKAKELEKSKEIENALIHLRCQHFLELLQQGQLPPAIQFAISSLSPYRHNPPPILLDCMGLLGYRSGNEGELKRLLGVGQREKISFIVNESILKAECPNENVEQSKLEQNISNLSSIQSFTPFLSASLQSIL